jgi:uncharacterized protein YjbJ (UPF0337 family)
VLDRASGEKRLAVARQHTATQIGATVHLLLVAAIVLFQLAAGGSTHVGLTPPPFRRTDHHERRTSQGKWHQLKGEVKSQWGKLTDDDLDRAEGDAEKLIGRIQERYGYARDDAKREVDAFFDRHL